MATSQHSQLSVVPETSRRERPAQPDDVFEPLLECKEAAVLLRIHPKTLLAKAQRRSSCDSRRQTVVVRGLSVERVVQENGELRSPSGATVFALLHDVREDSAPLATLPIGWQQQPFVCRPSCINQFCWKGQDATCICGCRGCKDKCRAPAVLRRHQ